MVNHSQFSRCFHVVVMAGGSGTRFWPESTQKRPKQYLTFGGDKTLIEQTLNRFSKIVPNENIRVVTLEDQKEVALQYSGKNLTKKSLILEPCARNTAPCILLSLAKLLASGQSESDSVGFFAADHLIRDGVNFKKIINNSLSFIEEHQKIVTLGINPSFPHTGFGYIEAATPYKEEGFFAVGDFKEKPDLKTAKNYLLKGNYFWNAGMFIAKIKTLLSEFQEYAPDLYTAFLEMKKAFEKNDEVLLKQVYEKVRSISIDFAIMEKTRQVAVVKADIGWNDVGSWDALAEILPETDGNTFAREKKKRYLENSRGNIIFSTEKEKMMTLIDVNDLIVIENEQNLVVMPKSSAQKVKNVIEHLKKSDYGNELL